MTSIAHVTYRLAGRARMERLIDLDPLDEDREDLTEYEGLIQTILDSHRLPQTRKLRIITNLLYHAALSADRLGDITATTYEL